MSKLSPKHTALVSLLSVLVTPPAFGGLFDLFRDDVPTIGVDELAAILDGAGAEGEASGDGNIPVLLVDVRSANEVGVSMIPGAVTREAYERDTAAFAGYRIVSYCTVGVRSERYTRDLLEDGVDAVNFEGSILAWIEAGLPLVTPSGEPTRQVHTWSRWYRVPDGYEQVTD